MRTHWYQKRVVSSLLAGFVLLWFSGHSVFAQDTLTIPKPGDPVRKTLFNLLRPAVEKSAHQKVLFQVQQIHLLHGWAFLDVVPIKPDQTPLDRKKAHLELDDGNSVVALFHKVDGKWGLVTKILWPTDVSYPEWADRYQAPKQIFVYHTSQ